MALYNGGSAGGIWMFAIVCIGMFFVTLSFAEMVSMMPTSGAQYHWVSELAPRKYQKFLSYVVGMSLAILQLNKRTILTYWFRVAVCYWMASCYG
jgi:choline transport protein